MKIQLSHKFKDIISLENLLSAWQEFIVGKKRKKDIQIFSRDLLDNILSLHRDLANLTYQHGGYEDFYVNDPKRRHVHKASVRDRLLHHAIYRILYPFFDKVFIPDSFFCRNRKGTHKALNRFKAMFYKASKNDHQVCWALKCDVKKFFDSVDHEILLGILDKYIPDKEIMSLLGEVIDSYHSGLKRGIGLPLGNLTSQLFANIYMDVFDQFIKHKLKIKYCIRYSDDFIILSADKNYLHDLMPEIQKFLLEKLKLALHPNKIFLQAVSSGVDWLGWKHFADHRLLREITRRKMLKRIKASPINETLQSYLGLLQHGNSVKIREELLNAYWLRKNYD